MITGAWQLQLFWIMTPRICGCDQVMHQWASCTCFSCFYMCENGWSLTLPVHGFFRLLQTQSSHLQSSQWPLLVRSWELLVSLVKAHCLFTYLLGWLTFWVFSHSHYGDYGQFQSIAHFKTTVMRFSFGATALIGGIFYYFSFNIGEKNTFKNSPIKHIWSWN